jgi:hypothetical protein
LVVPWDDGRPADEWAAIGVTCLVRWVWPKDEGWVEELRTLAANPPDA